MKEESREALGKGFNVADLSRQDQKTSVPVTSSSEEPSKEEKGPPVGGIATFAAAAAAAARFKAKGTTNPDEVVDTPNILTRFRPKAPAVGTTEKPSEDVEVGRRHRESGHGEAVTTTARGRENVSSIVRLGQATTPMARQGAIDAAVAGADATQTHHDSTDADGLQSRTPSTYRSTAKKVDATTEKPKARLHDTFDGVDGFGLLSPIPFSPGTTGKARQLAATIEAGATHRGAIDSPQLFPSAVRQSIDPPQGKPATKLDLDSKAIPTSKPLPIQTISEPPVGKRIAGTGDRSVVEIKRETRTPTPTDTESTKRFTSIDSSKHKTTIAYSKSTSTTVRDPVAGAETRRKRDDSDGVENVSSLRLVSGYAEITAVGASSKSELGTDQEKEGRESHSRKFAVVEGTVGSTTDPIACDIRGATNDSLATPAQIVSSGGEEENAPDVSPVELTSISDTSGVETTRDIHSSQHVMNLGDAAATGSLRSTKEMEDATGEVDTQKKAELLVTWKRPILLDATDQDTLTTALISNAVTHEVMTEFHAAETIEVFEETNSDLIPSYKSGYIETQQVEEMLDVQNENRFISEPPPMSASDDREVATMLIAGSPEIGRMGAKTTSFPTFASDDDLFQDSMDHLDYDASETHEKFPSPLYVNNSAWNSEDGFGDGFHDDQSHIEVSFDDSSIADMADTMQRRNEASQFAGPWMHGETIENYMGWADQAIKASDTESVRNFAASVDLNDFDDESTIATAQDDMSVMSELSPTHSTSHRFENSEFFGEIAPPFDESDFAHSSNRNHSLSVSYHLSSTHGISPQHGDKSLLNMGLSGLSSGLTFGVEDAGFDDGLGFGGTGLGFGNDDDLDGLVKGTSTPVQKKEEPKKKSPESKGWFRGWMG